MKIVIETAGFDAGQNVHQFAQCCAGFELGTFKNRVDSVTISIRSLEDALDGKNKTCQVEVILPGQYPVSAQAANADLYVATYWALERAGWAVADRLEQEPADSGAGLPERPRAAEHAEPNRAA